MSHPQAEHLLAIIRTRYGDRVTPDELEEIKKSLTAILDASTAMRAVKLENGDEPHQTFKPAGDPK